MKKFYLSSVMWFRFFFKEPEPGFFEMRNRSRTEMMKKENKYLHTKILSGPLCDFGSLYLLRIGGH